MSHLRRWRFVVPSENEARFVAAYGSDGDWSRLFGEADGFVKVELWRDEDGSFITADHWRDRADFGRFQRDFCERYRTLDAELEGLASDETFIAALDSASLGRAHREGKDGDMAGPRRPPGPPTAGLARGRDRP